MLPTTSRLAAAALAAVLAAAALSAAGSAHGAESARRPNIVLIMCDDMGYEGVSAYGSPSYRTPVLDRLAAEGVRFTHCYSQPICTPSRVQIMTGRYNMRNYVRFGLLDTGETTFANLLRDAGYATAIAGKWQLGGDGATVKKFGFDTHCLWHLDGRDSRYWNPRISRDGQLLRGLEDRFGPDVMCDYILEFITRQQRQSPEQPFLVYYPTCLVHWPFVPTPDSPPGGSRKRSGKYDGRAGGVEYFDDMVAYMDKLIGRIADRIDELGIRDETLILFTCDNGCAINITSKMGDGVIRGGKGRMVDAGTRVALVARGAGVEPGQVIDDLVDFSDVLPTLAAAAGVSTDGLQLDGRSFLPQLQGRPGRPRDWIFCHYTRNGPPRQPTGESQRKALLKKQAQARAKKQLGRFARTGRYKLYDDGPFYDVQQDVLEQRPIAAGQGSDDAERTRRMLQQVHDSMPPWQAFRQD